MSEWAAKRFWSEVSIGPGPEGWTILLDGRPVRTPSRALLAVPTEGLAQAIAAEWRAQEGRIDPASMPATRMANSAIDTVRPNHAAIVAIVAAYGGTDLLCYRAPGPDRLVLRQAEAWDPLLDWAADRFGVRLRTVAGVMPVAQDSGALAALNDAVAARDAFRLMALHDLVSLSGSLILGLAVAERHLDTGPAWHAARIDEDFQTEEWGEDAEAAAQAASRAAAFLDAARFDLLAQPATAVFQG